ALGLGSSTFAVVRPERLAVGPAGPPSVPRQSLPGVTTHRDAGGIFVPPLGRGPAPENPPAHSPPHATSRVRPTLLGKCRLSSSPRNGRLQRRLSTRSREQSESRKSPSCLTSAPSTLPSIWSLAMPASPGTVSKILWHFTGGPIWDEAAKRQK